MISYEHIIELAKDKEDYNPKDWDAYHFLVYGKPAPTNIKPKRFKRRLKKSLTSNLLYNIIKKL